MLIEALADGGVKSGLPRDLALNLSAYMVRGSAEMVISTHKHPGMIFSQLSFSSGIEGPSMFSRRYYYYWSGISGREGL